MKICFVALHAYSLFNRDTNYKLGGSEVRSWLFSVGLSEHSYNQVSVVVNDYRQPSVEQYGNVTVYAHPGYKQYRTTTFREAYSHVMILEHFPYRWLDDWSPSVVAKVGFAFLQAYFQIISRWLRARLIPNYNLRINDYVILRDLYRIYDVIDADVYCVIGVHHVSAEVAAYCRHAGKKYVLIGGHDRNFSDHYQRDSTEPDFYGIPSYVGYYCITEADLIIAQSQGQARMVEENFGRQSVTIPNPIDLKARVVEAPPYSTRKTVLWVGRPPRELKRPEIFLRLAIHFPEIPFLLIMNRDRAEFPGLFAELEQEKPSNVTILERVPFHEIEAIYSQAFVLVNTSTQEGFPNAFLQAAKYGVPILSYDVDPDSFISRKRCGIVAGGRFDRFMSGLEAIIEDQKGPQQFSRNILRYVHQNHDLHTNTLRLNEAIRSMIVET